MPHNVDDLLVTGIASPEVKDVKEDIISKDVKDEVKPEKIKSEVAKEIDPEREEKYLGTDKNPSITTKEIEEKKAESKSEDAKSDYDPDKQEEDEDVKDEYGNDRTKKSKMYSEEEVQRMIRDRLKRGGTEHQPPTTQQVAKVADDFKFDENSEQGWQEQLEQFVDRRIDSREQKAANTAKEAKLQREKAEFDDKFMRNMDDYPDFIDTVRDHDITDAMIHATKEFKQPAAFLYAAAKAHPKELARISALPDALAQASAIGRLEERMRKAKQATKAAKPIVSDKGDYNDKAKDHGRNIDSLIERHAKTKIR